MKVTKQQIKVIFAVLPAAYRSDKELCADLIQQFTKDWDKTSTTDLSFKQANELIERFGGKAQTYDHWGKFDFKQTSHRLVLSLVNQMQWQTYSQKYRGMIADMQRFSEWLKSDKSPVKKPLQKMNSKEVSKIIVALENMVASK
ncbi:MAG: hypothetical protein COB73_00895 [Flavobacteriaceae bacterium]|nr:MAG: hypothetical protein COB73_00895 [Flavobacteriaceae bacterium]